MITLTKLDNTRILINVEAIKYIEHTPDTLILFLNGESLIVRESLDEIERRVIEFKRKVVANRE
jgi:flagellar protein FlbD